MKMRGGKSKSNQMKKEIKRLPKNLIEIVVEVPPEEMAAFYRETFESLTKKTIIPGFRPGKAPHDLLKKEMEETKILEQAAESAINKIYQEIIEQEKINPLGQPKVEIQKLAPDNPFIFKLTLSLFPTVKLGDYKKIKIKPAPKIEIKDEAVEKIIKELQSARGQDVVVNREAQRGDKVKIDFDMFIDRVPLENGQIRDFYLVVGENEFLPGLSENIKGLKRNEEREFSFTYPVEHYDKKIAGKKVDFKIKVKEVYQINLPELNDRFAQSIGRFQNLSELKNKIRENLQEEQRLKEEEKKEIEILRQLAGLSTFEEIPDILLEYETEKMIDELRASIKDEDNPSAPKFEDYLRAIKKTEEELKKEFISRAEERVKIALLIKEISLKENIQPTEEEIEKEIEKLKNFYQGDEDILKNINSEIGRAYARNLATNYKVINWLKNQCL